MSETSAIPLIDLGEESLAVLARTRKSDALALVRAGREAFGLPSRLASAALLPLSDQLCRRWLERTGNPYLREIDDIASVLNTPGTYTLNLAYEWGCTSGVYMKDGTPHLTRILDWPFRQLGEKVAVVKQRGPAGEFHNVTWPGMSGVFTAQAKGRFAAALNQAPMRRYRCGGLAADWVKNRIRFFRQAALPPAHLLRRVCETAKDYAEAKERLSAEPVALPVIYILSGTKPGEGCVIERLEDTVAVREMNESGQVCAANHFESWLNGMGHGWMPRAIDSHRRAEGAREVESGHLEDFAWFRAPMANGLSRLAVQADARSGALTVRGTDGERAVTASFALEE